jgi:hypothetical protein
MLEEPKMTVDFISSPPAGRMEVGRVALGALAALGLFMSAGSTLADAYPHQKPGLWQSEMKMAGTAMTTKVCVDEAMTARGDAFSAGPASKMCSKRTVTHNLDGSWTSISTCEFRPGQPHTSRVDVVGDFNSKVMMKMTRPPATTPEMTMTMTRLGPCAPGQKGGDMIMPNGQTVNAGAGRP